MTPNNNLSVLPFYSSIDEQNARRWWIYGKIYPLYTPAGFVLPFQLMRSHRQNAITRFEILSKDGAFVIDELENLQNGGLQIVTFNEYDVIVFPGRLPVFKAFDNGQYYAVMSDGVETWYSEVFTVVNDISGFLKIEWWDVENFVMDAGIIVYKEPAFHNVLYLCADIAKPDYEFEDEVIKRDGYTFPVKQISTKKYRFSFLASEYLLDVMRFIRMSDFVNITKNGHEYNVIDTFLITPEWEDNGDVAAVEAEFTTSTVAKKLGFGHIGGADFNNDFNNDFKIEENG